MKNTWLIQIFLFYFFFFLHKHGKSKHEREMNDDKEEEQEVKKISECCKENLNEKFNSCEDATQNV